MRGKSSGTVAIEREDKIYTGSYTIAQKMITVAHGSRVKTTQLGGFADAPEVLARIMLGEMVGEEKQGSR